MNVQTGTRLAEDQWASILVALGTLHAAWAVALTAAVLLSVVLGALLVRLLAPR